MELIYNLLANFLFAFMTVAFVVLTTGLMLWLLLLEPKKKRETGRYGFRGGAMISPQLCAQGYSAGFRRGC